MPEWISALPVVGGWPMWAVGAAAGALAALLYASCSGLGTLWQYRSGRGPDVRQAGDRALLPQDPDVGTLGEWAHRTVMGTARLSIVGGAIAWTFDGHENSMGLFGLAIAILSLLSAARAFTDRGRHGTGLDILAVDEAEPDPDATPAARFFFAALGIGMAALEWLV